MLIRRWLKRRRDVVILRAMEYGGDDDDEHYSSDNAALEALQTSLENASGHAVTPSAVPRAASAQPSGGMPSANSSDGAASSAHTRSIAVSPGRPFMTTLPDAEQAAMQQSAAQQPVGVSDRPYLKSVPAPDTDSRIVEDRVLECAGW